MTRTLDVRNLGTRCAEFLGFALPEGAKIKAVEEIIGQGRGTACRLTRGEMPTTVQIAALTQHFGREFLDHVFGDLISEGDMAWREASAARLLSAARRECDAESLRSPVASIDHGAGRRGQLEPGAAGSASARLTDERLSLDNIIRFPTLAEQLERWRDRLGRMEPNEAVSWARADATGRTGVVVHRIGDVHRFAYRPRTGTLVAPGASIVGMPITAGSDSAYGAMIEKTCLDAEASPQPIFSRLHGRVPRTDGRIVTTDVAVLRTVFRSKRRESSVVSTFVPLTA